jgi:hypothetical protein
MIEDSRRILVEASAKESMVVEIMSPCAPPRRRAAPTHGKTAAAIDTSF